MENILKETNFQNLGEKKVGKVRDVYFQKDRLILISTDRHSSFDRIIAFIPHKGQVLNQTSAFWFEKTKDIVKNHVLEIPDPNVTVAKRCEPLPIEMVVRGYITGVTSTSLWTLYQKGQRDFGDFVLPEGMRKNQKLDKPVLTPSTKSDEHDVTITPEEVVSKGLLSQAIWDKVAGISLELFKRGQKIARESGLILVDTKYEFGLDESGEVTLIDEIHTPDSSRYWQAESYEERFKKGKEPEYFDKEFLRLWFKENSNPYEDENLPEAPQKLVRELSVRYIRIYEQITGKKFENPADPDIIKHIGNNLKRYGK